ncbi:MAG: hypothetical protein GC155_18510 [Alphaproteobacteria bacterium]|nr:hypothetical protein [Alphaproteobacteria bacterium]
MALKQVVLRLARNPDYPEGDPTQGYVITAPLTDDGRLDAEEWTNVRTKCRVVRFRANEERHADGFLTHRGARWFIHYDEEGEGDDEPVYRLGDHRLAVGEYVTIEENDGPSLTYRVTEHAPVQHEEHLDDKGRMAAEKA